MIRKITVSDHHHHPTMKTDLVRLALFRCLQSNFVFFRYSGSSQSNWNSQQWNFSLYISISRRRWTISKRRNENWNIFNSSWEYEFDFFVHQLFLHPDHGGIHWSFFVLPLPIQPADLDGFQARHSTTMIPPCCFSWHILNTRMNS